MRLLLGLFALTVFHRRASVTPFREFVCDERSIQKKNWPKAAPQGRTCGSHYVIEKGATYSLQP